LVIQDGFTIIRALIFDFYKTAYFAGHSSEMSSWCQLCF